MRTDRQTERQTGERCRRPKALVSHNCSFLPLLFIMLYFSLQTNWDIKKQMNTWCRGGGGVWGSGGVTDRWGSDSNIKEKKAHWAQWHKVCTDMDSCGDQMNKTKTKESIVKTKM